MKRFLNFKVFVILLLSILTIGLTSCGAINAQPNLLEAPIVESSSSEGSINESSNSNDENIIDDNFQTNLNKINSASTASYKSIDNADNWWVQHPSGDPNFLVCLVSPLNNLNNGYVTYTDDYIDLRLRADD